MSKPLRMGRMAVVILRDTALFPRVGQQLDIVRPSAINAVRSAEKSGDQNIFITMQRDKDNASDIYTFGVAARIRQVTGHPVTSGALRIRVECLYRCVADELEEIDGVLFGNVTEQSEIMPKNAQEAKIMRAMLSELVQKYLDNTPKKQSRMQVRVIMDSFNNLERLGELCDFLGHALPISGVHKQEILEQCDHARRCELLMAALRSELSENDIKDEIEKRVQESMDRNQREYYLREQIKVISEELGDSDSPAQEAEEYRARIEKLTVSDEVRDRLFKTCDKLSKLPSGSHEASVERNYLDICLSLPWGVMSKDKLDVVRAEKKLDRDHYGMKKVKERILEFIAVRALAPDIKGQIICLVGPPGVGKTSIARSVAEALGKKYCRISLGGVHDEADIRGHRKTYIGSMPGRIVDALKTAGTCNPLILLDEVDKLANDYRGDPTSALLEVLDPEQNSTFHDHFIDLPIDLSNVMFITTANDYGRIPAPLLDRMEVIELPSYTQEEKLNIAKRHLIKKQIERHGLTAKQIRFTDKAIIALINGYTSEAGVRTLERNIASLCRKTAKKIASGEAEHITITDKLLPELLGPARHQKDEIQQSLEPGIANGLAWTSVGGVMLEIETAILDGSGKIELTGSLGDVMRESARTAISYIRSRAKEWGIDPDFYKNKDIHIHCPEGATPKDGPSAGITMATAIVSALTGIPVRSDTAMTGEITLRGRVLPIGGLREKSMAAYMTGIKRVIIPGKNEPDVSELSDKVRDSIEFIPAYRFDTVIENALTTMPAGSADAAAKSRDVYIIPENGGKHETGESRV